jgi:2'-5' RNA ligase
VQTPPLVLTLQLDAASQERFDELRREHFPAERNHLQAHVTLFHALPAQIEQQVRDDLARSAQRAPYHVRVPRVRSLGRGVAYDLRSPVLQEQRDALAGRWWTWLTAQDARPHAPHVTVQNKVDPPRARALLQRLQEDFVPYEVTATGLALWRYRGGPWEPLSDYPFSMLPTG